MNKFRNLISFVLIAMLCVNLCACGISKTQVVGTWSSNYEYNGSQFSATFELSDDGTYSQIYYKDGNRHKNEVGTWEIVEGQLRLHENGEEGSYAEYTYQNGKLINGGREFSRK